MSTVILTEPYEAEVNGKKVSHAKGDKISVPFTTGKQLVAEKKAQYPTPSAPVAKKEASEIALLKAEVARLQAENAQLKTDCDELVKDNDDLAKQVESLTKPLPETEDKKKVEKKAA